MAISHKRDTNARPVLGRKHKAAKIAAPLALVATASAVSLWVLAGDPVATSASAPSASGKALSAATAQRGDVTTRSTSRMSPATSALDAAGKAPNLLSKAMTAKAIRRADTRLWTTDVLNIWDQPGQKARKLGELDAGERVLVTGRELWGRDEIVLGGRARWVTSGYLTDEEPATLGGTCSNGTTVPSGVSPSIVAVHQAVCANFPEISVYGTLRGGGGDHPLGKAVDIMVSGERGWQVARFVQANYAALGVSYIIYSQNIWSVERAGEGWRGMENRGSVTANHYDHVHVSVY